MISHDTEQYTFNKIGGEKDRRLLRRMLVFAAPHKGALTATVGLLISGLALRLAGPFLIRRAIDGPIAEAARDRGTEAFDVEGLTADVTRIGLMFLAVAAGTSMLQVAREWLMSRTGQRIVLTIRDALFHHTLRLPVSWYDHHHVGWTVTRTTSDVDALSELFTTGVATIAYDIMTILVVLGVLFWLSPAMALLALLILPIMIRVTFDFRLKARLAYRDTRKSLSRLNGFLQERLTGLDVVRIFRRQDASAARFDTLNGDYYRDNMVTVRHFSLFFPTVDVLSWVLRLSTLILGGWLIARDSLTPGTFVMYWLLLDFIFEPVRELAERYNVLQAAMAAGERIFGIFDAAEESGAVPVPDVVAAAEAEALSDPAEAHDVAGGPTVRQHTTMGAGQASDGAAAQRLRVLPGEDTQAPLVAFEHVSFAYGDGPDVIKDVSFTIRRGERVAVVGHTGAGKSTLTSLLCRFHETDRGTVRFAGVDVKSVPHDLLRRRIAVVQQDVFLFSDTISANVRMGDPSLTQERLAEVARAVNAERFIERLPDRYETTLQERGANLSSGQRQLVAFARALAADPDLLILDEATSSVDSETESWIEEATATLLAGRTSLVIAHRLSTVVNADRILVMHHGELYEEGTHEELLALKGLYHRLYRLHLAASAG